MFRQSELFNFLKAGGQGAALSPNMDKTLGSILNSINVDRLTENKFNKEKLDRIYSYPADHKEAQIHKIASKYGYRGRKLRNGQEVPICPCCENYPSTIDIPLCYETQPSAPVEGSEVFLLQTGVAMYFTFIKMVIVYLVIRFLIVDIYTIFKSMNGDYCSALASAATGETCSYSISGYNLKHPANQSDLNGIDILNLVLTVLSIVYFLFYRKLAYRLQSWLDYNDVTQDDFSILIENIPSFLYQPGARKDEISYDHELVLKNLIEEKIRNWFTQLNIYHRQDEIQDNIDRDFWNFYVHKRRTQVFSDDIVTSITLCYDLTEMENINKIRERLVSQCLQQEDDSAQRTKSDLIEYVPNQIDLINQEYLNLCYKYAMDGSASFNLSHFTGKAIVSFQYQHYRDYFLRQYEKDKQFLKINKKPISIFSASKPADVYWYNMKVTDNERSKNIFYSSVVLFMELILSFAALFGIQIWRNSKETYFAASQGSTFSDLLLSVLLMAAMAILTNVINFFLSYSIEILSDLEKHVTKTNRLRSLIIKTIITQTINTLFIYFILYHVNPRNPLDNFGLVSKVTSLVIISGFLSVALQVLIPFNQIMDLINGCRYSKDKTVKLFQYQLNEALQHPEFNFAVMYSFYIVFTFVISFYGILVPLATPILVLIFFLQFWVDKYNLFRRFSYPVDLGPSLNRMIIKIFELSMLMAAVGHMIWDATIHYDSSASFKTINIINLAIAGLYTSVSMVAPYSISKRIFEEQNDFEHHRYTDFLQSNRFLKTYYRESPATSCLKEAKIAKLKQEANENNRFMHQAPDPLFINPKELDRYLNLKREDIHIDSYNRLDVANYENFGNKEYDQITAELEKNGGLANLIANPQAINGMSTNKPFAA